MEWRWWWELMMECVKRWRRHWVSMSWLLESRVKRLKNKDDMMKTIQ